MGWRGWLVIFGVCAIGLAALVIAGSNLYWGLDGTDPAGAHFLFGRAVPEPWGRWLWIGIKPAMLATLLSMGWSLYRFIARWRQSRRPGVCRVCGYDLRATPGRCPECGTATQNRAAS